MDPNPYDAPAQHKPRTGQQASLIGKAGLLLSLVGVTSIFVVGWTDERISLVGMYAAFCCLPGLVFSTIGYLVLPSRLAGWGIAASLFGACYLPTFWMTLTRH